MLEVLSSSFALFAQPENALALFVGVIVGTVIGAIPGMTTPMGVALALPFTFTMQPVTELSPQGLAGLDTLLLGIVNFDEVLSVQQYNVIEDYVTSKPGKPCFGSTCAPNRIANRSPCWVNIRLRTTGLYSFRNSPSPRAPRMLRRGRGGLQRGPMRSTPA